MVREVDCDSQLPSPDRDDETSVGTAVSDEEVIDRESIVDPDKADTKFLAAHVRRGFEEHTERRCQQHTPAAA